MRAVGLRLEGLQQSYGASVVGETRTTEDAPTQSAVLGMVGAALGIERDDCEALAALHRSYALVVRVDRRGVVGIDYHTASNVPGEFDGIIKPTVVTRRHYLEDASFAACLVEREGACVSCEQIIKALRNPVYMLCLGRRSCAPSVPLVAVREPLCGDSWRDLLAQVLSPPRHDGSHALRRVRRRLEPLATAWVDASLLTQQDEPMRRIRMRDRFVGPLPRIFLEREVAQIRVPRPDVDPVLRAVLHTRPRLASRPVPAMPSPWGVDTSKEWLP